MIFYQILLSSLITFTWIYYYVAGYRMVIFYFYCSFHIYQLAFSWKEETFHPCTLLFTLSFTHIFYVLIFIIDIIFFDGQIVTYWSTEASSSWVLSPLYMIQLTQLSSLWFFWQNQVFQAALVLPSHFPM